jgi:uncharacterized protein YidB (DUF937 family)
LLEEKNHMGLFDELAKNVGDSLFNDKESRDNLLSQVMNVMQDKNMGGLKGLVENFSQKGLGDLVSSWVGTGENKSISGNQIMEVLGQDTLENIAKKVGISQDSASSGVAQLLPQIIDKLTPEGKVAEGDLLNQGIDMLKNSLFK